MKTDYRGIDYGLGQTNIDRRTGIRYGVIPEHTILQIWADESEPDYGEPTCPKCGNEAESADAHDIDAGTWEHTIYECLEYACEACRYVFGAESAYGDTPNGYTYESDGYTAQSDGSGGVWLLKSKYYTRAAYCSPCSPGACYLINPCDSGERAYCFGHDWFEDGRAPYPVYRVSDDSEVQL